jgi:hypothetical protein
MKKTWRRRFVLDEVLSLPRDDQDTHYCAQPIRIEAHLQPDLNVECHTRITFNLPHKAVCHLPNLESVDVVLRFKEDGE